MSLKLIVPLTIGALSLPAMATSGLTPSPGEVGFKTHAMPASETTREQVRQDLSAWRRSPVTADGWQEVGGEVGWQLVGVPSRKSRAEVLQELANWQRNPVGADGWAQLGGEGGWVFVGPRASKAQSAAGAGTPSADKSPAIRSPMTMHGGR